MNKGKKLIVAACTLFFTFSFTACNGKEENKAEATVNVDTMEFTDFTKKISADDIYKTIEKFSATDDARLTGFQGEGDTAEYIKKQFQDLGFEVKEQSFPVKVYKCNSTELSIIENENIKIDSRFLQFSISTPKEGITAEIVYAGLGSSDDLENAKVNDKLVLIERGREKFNAKVKRAFEKGAVGVIFYDPTSDGHLSATLGEISNIPALSIIKADGDKLVKQLKNGRSLKATLKVDSEYKEAMSKNIIATMKSEKESNGKHFIVGAHYDGVNTPAANDNASGIATVMEAAKVLSNDKLNCDVKFIAFGAEEIGLVGSNHYVESLSADEKKNIITMINLDMVGVGDVLRIHTMNEGAKSLPADLAVSCASKFNYKYERATQSNSDHVPFESIGIPTACFEYGPDVNNHTDGDTIDKINKENLLNTCNVLLNMCKEIGENPEDFSLNIK